MTAIRNLSIASVIMFGSLLVHLGHRAALRDAAAFAALSDLPDLGAPDGAPDALGFASPGVTLGRASSLNFVGATIIATDPAMLTIIGNAYGDAQSYTVAWDYRPGSPLPGSFTTNYKRERFRQMSCTRSSATGASRAATYRLVDDRVDGRVDLCRCQIARDEMVGWNACSGSLLLPDRRYTIVGGVKSDAARCLVDVAP